MSRNQPGSPLRRSLPPDTPRFRADLERYLATQAHTARPQRDRYPASRRLVVAGICAAALAAVVAVVLLGPVTGSRPAAVARAETFVLPGGTTVDIGEFFDPANFDRLRQAFADHGAELVIHERPVAGPAIGRVFSVSTDFGGAPDSDPKIVDVEPGQRVEVEIGRAPRAGEQVDTEGLTLHEVFPTLPAAIDRSDPVATGDALRDLGFQIRWVLLHVAVEDGQFDNTSQDVDSPPPGTVIVSVLGPNGEWTDVDPATDTLMVELATPEEASQLGHGI